VSDGGVLGENMLRGKMMLAVIAISVVGCVPQSTENSSVREINIDVYPRLKECVLAAKREDGLAESKELFNQLTTNECDAAAVYVTQNPTRLSYHLLMGLRYKAPATYEALSVSVKAAILCDALRHASRMNDWGLLDPDDSIDGTLGKALLQLGLVAVPYLRPLLSDRSSVALEGSQESTESAYYGYRRADYAYRYITLIRNEKYVFSPDPLERDKQLRRLQQELNGTD
jgi:hypothetical protein